MVSKTLAKLVDQAIVPAVFLVAGKVLGVFVTSQYFGLSWELTDSGLFFALREEAVLVNTYSSLLMFAFAWLGFTSIAVSSHFFHDTHIPPRLAARLSSLNLLHLVETTYELYTKAVVWLAYVWLLALVFLVQSYFGNFISWVSLTCLGLAITSTAVFVADVEKEVHGGKGGKEPKSSMVKLKRLGPELLGS